MKKIFAAILAVLILVSGCAEEEKTPEKPVSEESSSAEKIEEEIPEDFEHNPVSKTVGFEDAVIYEVKGGGAEISYGNGKKAEIPIVSDQPGIPGAFWYASQEITAIIYQEYKESSFINILTTDNCGELWHEYMFGIASGEIEQINVHFYDAKNGFFSVNYADGRGILYRVKNRGSSIEKIGEVGNVWNMVFVDENHGFLVVGKDWVGIRKTSDGGKTWTDFEFAPPEFEHKEIRCYCRPVFKGDYGEVIVTVYLEGKTPYKEYKYVTNNFGESWEIAK